MTVPTVEDPEAAGAPEEPVGKTSQSQAESLPAKVIE